MTPADIWLHGASVGDIRALIPLLDGIQAARPELSYILSAQTRTGREMARQLCPNIPVIRPPIDIPPAPGRLLDKICPRLLILEYLELWPRWVSACVARNIPVIVVDGRITHRSLRIRPLLHRTAAHLTAFSAQTELDADNARRLGVHPDRIRIDGNGKYDGVSLAAKAPSPELRAALGEFDVVLGSIHADEIPLALSSLARTDLRVLIAPRYPKLAGRILRWARVLGVPARRRIEPSRPARWVVLDTIGELASAYGLGRVAVVGGTFGKRGGQNLVEPAQHGIPVIFGPQTANVFTEEMVLQGRGGWPVKNWNEAWKMAQQRLIEPGSDPRAALIELMGATERRMPMILSLI